MGFLMDKPDNSWVRKNNDVKNPNWKKHTFLGIFAVSFVYIANLFAVGALVNLVAFLFGLGVGDFVFKKLEKWVQSVKARNLFTVIIACTVFSIGLFSYVLSQQMKTIPERFEKSFEETTKTYKKYLVDNNDSAFTDNAALVQSLLIACKNGTVADANLVLQQGVNINDKLGGMTCLYAASQFGQVEIIDWALDAGAKIDDINGPMRITALHIAAQEGQVNSIKLLLKRGANPRAVNHYDRTPEYFARGLPNEKYQEIKSLLEGDKNIVIQRHETPVRTKVTADFMDSLTINDARDLRETVHENFVNVPAQNNSTEEVKDVSSRCEDVDFDHHKNIGKVTDELIEDIINCPNESDEWDKKNSSTLHDGRAK